MPDAAIHSRHPISVGPVARVIAFPGKCYREKLVCRLLGFGLGFLLALGLVATASATAAGDGITAATAISLPASLSATTTVVGSSGGAFVYYTFTSSSVTSAATLAVTVNPASPQAASGAGVNLYHAGSLIASTNGVNSSPSGVAKSVSFGASAGPVLVQVYNYLAGQPLTISFTVSGIGPVVPPASTASAPSAPMQSAPTPTTPAAPAGFVAASPSTLITWGSIVGSAGGAYNYYTFTTPANRATGTITLVVNPPDPVTNRAVGVNLSQNGIAIASLNTASAVPGVNSAGFPLTTAGSVLVQVYDYEPGVTAVYAIVISGSGIAP
jgi:hypothetical protein